MLKEIYKFFPMAAAPIKMMVLILASTVLQETASANTIDFKFDKMTDRGPTEKAILNPRIVSGQNEVRFSIDMKTHETNLNDGFADEFCKLMGNNKSVSYIYRGKSGRDPFLSMAKRGANSVFVELSSMITYTDSIYVDAVDINQGYFHHYFEILCQ